MTNFGTKNLKKVPKFEIQVPSHSLIGPLSKFEEWGKDVIVVGGILGYPPQP